jgi:hypothetical protein
MIVEIVWTGAALAAVAAGVVIGKARTKRKARIAELEAMEAERNRRYEAWKQENDARRAAMEANRIELMNHRRQQERELATRREQAIRNSVAAAKQRNLDKPSPVQEKRSIERSDASQPYPVQQTTWDDDNLVSDVVEVLAKSLKHSEPEVFTGKGGTADGGGASGDWSRDSSSSDSSSSDSGSYSND